MFDIIGSVKQILKHFSKKDILLLAALLIAFFVTRLIFLDGFPIFSDEAIYVRWAKIAWHDPSWRFISLTDGKQPLQTWGTIPFFKIFPHNLLLAGRLFAVSTGLFALIGVFVTLFYLFNKKAAYWGALFYVLTPYFLFYDRLALVDSGVNAFFYLDLFPFHTPYSYSGTRYCSYFWPHHRLWFISQVITPNIFRTFCTCTCR